MKVTVLLAVYNGDRYLRHAIDDTLAQTFEDFELLVVDDASTDRTADILAAYSDSRVRVIRNETNMGQAPSLNRGLVKARGEYVARIDADDRMLPTRLERQVAVLDAAPKVALVGTWIDVIDEHDRIWSKIRGDIRDPVDLVAAILIDRYPFGHPSLMYRRNIVLELGGYDASLAPAEDKDLYRRLALSRREVRVIRQPLVRYRRHEAQLSQIQQEHQLAVDHMGQERFLTELIGRSLASDLRRLLAEGVARDSAPGALLDELVDRIAEHFGFTQSECDRLRKRLATHLTKRAVGAGKDAAPVLVWASRFQPSARVVAKILGLSPAIHLVASSSRGTLQHPLLQPLSIRARRSRALRWLYSTLLGGS